jgi:hypothetical protein
MALPALPKILLASDFVITIDCGCNRAVAASPYKKC